MLLKDLFIFYVFRPTLYIFIIITMLVLSFLIVAAVAIGLAWAYFNFQQIKAIPIASHYSVDD
jgi:MFS superfamily sulfate permease-like transporter